MFDMILLLIFINLKEFLYLMYKCFPFFVEASFLHGPLGIGFLGLLVLVITDTIVTYFYNKKFYKEEEFK
jgi:hypothetical protein